MAGQIRLSGHLQLSGKLQLRYRNYCKLSETFNDFVHSKNTVFNKIMVIWVKTKKLEQNTEIKCG